MQPKFPLISALALLLAVATGDAVAQQAPPPPPPPSTMQPAPPPGDRLQVMDRHDHGHAMGRHGFDGPGAEVIADLRGLERLYVQAGRARELPALYNDVLAKSQDPRVRNYAYHQLARAQAQPANVDAAIATLRKSLAENLANEAKQHARMEKMRDAWQQKHAMSAAPATH